MKIEAVPRFYAEAVSPNIKGDHIWISITSSRSEFADLKPNPNCKGILRLSFDDVGDVFKFDDCDRNSIVLTPISDDQALGIWEFVDARLGTFEKIFVHCDAGISRSPAVAAALSKHYLGSEEYFFKVGIYFPQEYTYRTLLKMKDIPVDDQQLKQYYYSLQNECVRLPFK